MSGYGNYGMPLGTPGSFPLPVKGENGSTFAANARMHPAALAAATPSRQNPMNAGHPAMAGKK